MDRVSRMQNDGVRMMIAALESHAVDFGAVGKRTSKGQEITRRQELYYQLNQATSAFAERAKHILEEIEKEAK